MFRLCRHTLLAVLTVIAVLCGLAHQISDRFQTHHHCAMAEECCDQHHEESPAHNHHEKPCDHAMCAHSVLALLESSTPNLIRVWVEGPRVAEPYQRPPGVEPADIEHPPQLA
jgi:hypothetical protein